MSGRDWRRLSGYVRSRRIALGYASTRDLARAVGISERTIGNLERGQAVGLNTLATVETLLEWRPGSALAVLDGGEPEEQRGGRPSRQPLDMDREIREQILNASPMELVEWRKVIERAEGSERADEWLRGAIALIRSERQTAVDVTRDAG